MVIRGKTTAAIVFGILTIVGGGYGFYCGLLNAWNSVSPGAHVNSIPAFQEFLPEPKAIVQIIDGGKKQFIIYGRQPLFLLSEAPAGYIFDSKGQLLDWSVEATDSNVHHQKWALADREIMAHKELTYNEAIALAAEE
jgi:hypothetical protein